MASNKHENQDVQIKFQSKTLDKCFINMKENLQSRTNRMNQKQRQDTIQETTQKFFIKQPPILSIKQTKNSISLAQMKLPTLQKVEHKEVHIQFPSRNQHSVASVPKTRLKGLSILQKQKSKDTLSFQKHKTFNRLSRPSRSHFNLSLNLNSSSLGDFIVGLTTNKQYIKTKQAHQPPKELSVQVSQLKCRASKKPGYLDTISKNKERFYLDFLQKVRISNGVNSTKEQIKQFKYFIGPGNNSQMVKRVLRTRWWWGVTNKEKEANFIWTSVLQRKIIENLYPALPNYFILNKKKNQTSNKRQLDCQQHMGHHLIFQSQWFFPLVYTDYVKSSAVLYNKISKNKNISNKTGLFHNLQIFCNAQNTNVFQIVPLTFHIKYGTADYVFYLFHNKFIQEQTKNKSVWIIKPGQNTNRGNGIQISDNFQQIKEIIQSNTHQYSYIIQQYICNPLLIHKRKFDIRCYGLVTIINGHIQGYQYTQGYIRTSSQQFNLQPPFDKYTHLTNDAIQSHSQVYGKFQAGNKLSYGQFKNYLANIGRPNQLEDTILPQIKETIKKTFRATYSKLDTHKRMHCFELFGFDFMVDSDMKVWLIEANTNPCLEEGCALLSRLLPSMIDNTFRVALDPLFPPPPNLKKLQSWLNCVSMENKYELIFSEARLSHHFHH